MNKIITSFPNTSQTELEQIAIKISPIFKAGDVIALSGDLGIGKSTFARAFIRNAMGNKDEEVPSPTFTLVQHFVPKNTNYPEIWHFDMYRLAQPKDALELGIEDAFLEGLSIIEWPQKLDTFLPRDSLIIKITSGDIKKGFEEELEEESDTRTLEFFGNSDWKNRLQSFGKTQ